MYKTEKSGSKSFFKFIIFLIFLFFLLSNYQIINYSNNELSVISLNSEDSDFSDVLNIKQMKYTVESISGEKVYNVYVYTNGKIIPSFEVSSTEFTLLSASVKLMGGSVTEHNQLPATVFIIAFIVIIFIPTKTKILVIEKQN